MKTLLATLLFASLATGVQAYEFEQLPGQLEPPAQLQSHHLVEVWFATYLGKTHKYCGKTGVVYVGDTGERVERLLQDIDTDSGEASAVALGTAEFEKWVTNGEGMNREGVCGLLMLGAGYNQTLTWVENR